jgi:hypothetical protein
LAYGIWDSIPGTRVLGLDIRVLELDIWTSIARQGIRDLISGTQQTDKGFGTQYLELGFQDLIPGTWVSGLNIWNSIFSIWDSGLNIRHLGFGTQNQELLDILNSGFRT